MARFCSRNYNGLSYSYGRRSPGLQFEPFSSPIDLPALGRCQPLYVGFPLRRDLCFCLTVAWPVYLRRRSLPLTVKRGRATHPFSRSYGVILQSSFRRVLPIALVYSTRLPASVCGTVTLNLTRGFSRRLGSPHLPHCCGSHSPFTLSSGRICLSRDGYGLRRT